MQVGVPAPGEGAPLPQAAAVAGGDHFTAIPIR
jgi:hypothetical protein